MNNQGRFTYSGDDGLSEEDLAKTDRFTDLTKREYFAGLAMQGLLGNGSSLLSFSETAREAVRQADALLKELEK